MNTNKKSRKIRSISGKSKTVKPKTNKSKIPTRNQRFNTNNEIKSRTNAIKIRNSEIKQIYNRDYYGTELLPMTNILEYTNSISNELLDSSKRKIAIKKPDPGFDGFFIVNDILERKEKKADINIIIEQNPNMSLEKMLAYILYEPKWFPNGRLNIPSFKRQIGGDVPRIDIEINNEKYNVKEYSDNDEMKDYKIADDFNLKIMNVLSTFGVIDFDLVNKIDILVQQTIFSFIAELIHFMIIKKEFWFGFFSKKFKNYSKKG